MQVGRPALAIRRMAQRSSRGSTSSVASRASRSGKAGTTPHRTAPISPNSGGAESDFKAHADCEHLLAATEQRRSYSRCTQTGEPHAH